MGFRAPVFYAQKRVGLGGRVFNVLKFRSMRQDAERDGQARWATKGDSASHACGRIHPQVPHRRAAAGAVRAARAHELRRAAPGASGVCRGAVAEKIPYYVQRHCVKPGITGWAQLCYPYGSSEQDALEKLQYDLYYIKNNTFLFDLAILLQTVEVVVHGATAPDESSPTIDVAEGALRCGPEARRNSL